MLFSSTTFLYLFLPPVIILYYTLFRKHRLGQNILLLVASLVFYAWGEPKFVLIMILSIVVNWFFGLLVEANRHKKIVSRLIIAGNICFNIGILFIFKYLSFTCGLLKTISHSNIRIPEIALPIGISFFTFQALSYVLDVYFGRAKVQKNILYVGLYISFFPQLIAGPIVRYNTIENEILNRKENPDEFVNGFSRFIIGLGKKVLLANSFAALADTAFDQTGTLSLAFSWLGALAYTLQIYYDFSGYSDMAIGLGRMFGFHFLENFNYPYISTSVSDFWRRWHISLGSWFRDYLYIPLGGSKVTKSRLIFNLLIVWFLTGLWHGANYTFIIWGLMYFVLITLEKLTALDRKKHLYILRWVYTLFFVIIGWVLFRSASINSAWDYLKSMFSQNNAGLLDSYFTGYLRQNMIMLAIGILGCTPIIKHVKHKYSDLLAVRIVGALLLICIFVLSTAALVSSSYNPFIYFNF